MAMRIRINDLARELEVKGKTILDALLKVGVTEKKTHSSWIQKDEAERVRKYLAEHEPSIGNSRPATPAQDEFKPKIDLSHTSKPADVLKAITRAAPAPQPGPRPTAGDFAVALESFEAEKVTPAPVVPPPRPVFVTPRPRPPSVPHSLQPASSVPQSLPRSEAVDASKTAAPNPASALQPSRAASLSDTNQFGSELRFLQDDKLRAFAVQQVAELSSVKTVGANKCRLILAGSLLETLLLDALLPLEMSVQKTRTADMVRKKRKGEAKEISRWSLLDLVNAATELKVIGKRIKELAHQVRLGRNLIHPGLAIEEEPIREGDAVIAEEVLKMVIEDLRNRFRQESGGGR